MLPIIFMLPIIQLLVLANAATNELKNINLSVVDYDNTQISRELISHFGASPFYTIIPTAQSVDKALELVHSDKSDIVLVIPKGFQRDIDNASTPNVQLLVNSINGMGASIANAYTSSILINFTKNISINKTNANIALPPTISTQTSYWYNPELVYSHFMVPGILVILVTIIGMFLTALNLVR